ncbi:MAG: phosphonate metabolism protein/1,5-bisphosphokinase (PRPP-forming) PhnN [Hyphomicrobiaceae bacterium]
MSGMDRDARCSGKPSSGTLVLVVGPSGAGKDTLIGLARALLSGRQDIVFVRRTITRPAGADGERHLPMSDEAFAAAEQAGAFALSWRAHGLAYGLPCAMLDDLAAGRTVVANISRGMVEAAGALCARSLVVEVTAPPEVLVSRLTARGREDGAAVAQRLARPGVEAGSGERVRIENVGDPGVSAARLAELIAAARGGDGPR